MLPYAPIHRPIHNVVEPVTTALRMVEKLFYWKPQPFQPKPVSVETVDPNRTRPKTVFQKVGAGKWNGKFVDRVSQRIICYDLFFYDITFFKLIP